MAVITSQQPYVFHRQSWIDPFAWVCFTLATGTLVYVEGNQLLALQWRWIAIMILSWWLPGILLVLQWQPPRLNWPLVALFALGLGWCWQIALLILMHWVPGPLSYTLFLGVYAGGTLGLLLLRRTRVFVQRPIALPCIGWLLLLLFIAILLRLPEIGYHEFHQDETHLLRRANEAIRGGDDALARHTKGIGEIAAVMVVYRALGTVTEGAVRMPFALASVGSVLALALLGKRFFGDTRVGFAAGLLLAINGFALGLSRIAQYQGPLLLLSVLAFLAMWQFYRTQSPQWLGFAIVLSAFGLVMHYEFLLNFLPLLLLFVAGLRQIEQGQVGIHRQLFRTLLGTGSGALLAVAVTYLPLLFNPYFATTRSYLGSRLVEGQTNNFAFFLEMDTLYNSIYFAVGLLLLVLVGLIGGLRRKGRRSITLLLLAWFLPAATLYLFVVEYPGTHFYFIMPSWSLLAAPPLVALTFPNGSAWTTSSLPAVKWAIRGGVLLWLGLSIGYLSLLFFRQSPAYLVNYPETRLALYPAPYGLQIPEEPRFGFPIHQGWKTLGVLGEWGYIEERYASNERSDLLRWYLRSNDRVLLADNPAVVFVANHVQEPDPEFDTDLLEATYQRIGEVRVEGEAQIAIWAKELPAAGYLIYDAEHFSDAFDRIMPGLRGWLERPLQVTKASLGDALTLHGAAYNRTRFAPGQLLHLVLWWQVERPLAHDYKLFVHVADETGRPLAQWDGWPGQNTERTTTWQVGKQIEDHVLLELPAELPAGAYDLLVGFYDPVTGDRLGERAIRIVTLAVDS